MARRKKQIDELNYDLMITEEKKKIEKLSNELKESKKNLKKLEKDKIKYEEMKAAEEEEAKKAEIAKLIMESGKSIDEIKEMLSK